MRRVKSWHLDLVCYSKVGESFFPAALSVLEKALYELFELFLIAGYWRECFKAQWGHFLAPDARELFLNLEGCPLRIVFRIGCQLCRSYFWDNTHSLLQIQTSLGYLAWVLLLETWQSSLSSESLHTCDVRSLGCYPDAVLCKSLSQPKYLIYILMYIYNVTCFLISW